MIATDPLAESRIPEPGAIVHVRQRLYLVEQVRPPPHPGDATLVNLSCVDDDAQGQTVDVLWEHELDAEIRSGENWGRLAERGFDPPQRFAAYLNTLRWNCVTSTDPRLLQSPFRAGIQLDPYQLEPLRKALRLPRVNLFIADDVGLGKTIEAGLIARELLLRKKVREIVVSCPPSMLLQWQEELASRFGLQFEILDKDYIQRVRRERGFSVNPWNRLFANPVTRKPYHQEEIQKRYIRKAGIASEIGSDIGWHTFRHSYRSWLDETGAPLTVQKELMRHASIQTTMNVYGKAMTDTKRQAHRRVVELVLKPSKTEETTGQKKPVKVIGS